MRAILCKQYGPAEVLELGDIAKPEPRKGKLIIKVHAAEVTKGDCELRSFTFAVKWFAFPLRLAFGIFRPRNPVLGGYFAGKVESVGEGVEAFKPGDRVFGSSGFAMGAYAEYIRLSQNAGIAHIPENLSFEDAASVPLGGLNAIHFCMQADIKPGDKVLINGAGGSIGMYALQISKAYGAHVTAVDAPHKQEAILASGADEFIDYTRKPYTSLGKRWNVIIDMVAGSDLESSLACLEERGRYASANPTFKKLISANRVFKRTGKKVIVSFAAESKEELSELANLLREGKISTAVDQVFPMAEIIEAHKRVEVEARTGCVVVKIP
ncbi:NAD(P)-dependent alcohol dehydrogenase [Haliea sp. E17]|uniref:NAD(P)-dependent alcohol dehydrogenase n=1 Tax=Haliea sp. E17 TaxID=3401576 RepID=UPI003AABF1BD